MNTFQLTCFLAVADTLSFARAAEELNVTQPAITHQIHTLESELDVKLFRRTTRVVELTLEGKMFVEDARGMMAIARRAKKRLENMSEVVQYFSIGCQSYGQLFQMPDILRQLAARYPAVHPQIQVVPFLHLYRLLEEEEVDVIVGFKEADARKISGTYKELCKIPISCLCSADHPLAGRTRISVEALANEKLIVSDPVKVPNGISSIQGRLLNGRLPTDLFFCDSVESAMTLALAGLGIAILPDSFIPQSDSFIRIPIEGVEELSYGAYYKKLQGNEVLKAFIGLMEEKLQN